MVWPTYYDQALTIAKDAFGPESVYALHFQQKLATLAGEKGDYAGSVRQLRALLPVFERNGDTAKTHGTLGDIAGLEALQGHHEQAREDIDRALAIAEPLIGPEHPNMARLLVISSMVASGLGPQGLCGRWAQGRVRVGRHRRLARDARRMSQPSRGSGRSELAIRTNRGHSAI